MTILLAKYTLRLINIIGIQTIDSTYEGARSVIFKSCRGTSGNCVLERTATSKSFNVKQTLEMQYAYKKEQFMMEFLINHIIF